MACFQAPVGSFVKGWHGQEHPSGDFSRDCTVTSTRRVIFPSNARQQARLSAHFVTHRGISVIFPFITPWVSIARGIEAEMPLIARRKAHFITRRLILLPVGTGAVHFVTHRGILVFFSSITYWPCLHLASTPKCPAQPVRACRSTAKAPVGCPMAG